MLIIIFKQNRKTLKLMCVKYNKYINIPYDVNIMYILFNTRVLCSYVHFKVQTLIIIVFNKLYLCTNYEVISRYNYYIFNISNYVC